MILCAAVSVLTSALTGNITLRFSHPTAQEVALRIDSLAPQRMTRASKDAWEIKLPDLAPGIYSYNFYVGQTSFHDPNNPLRKPIHGGGFESILEVRGDGSQIWDRRTAPYGKLVEFKFRSEMFGEMRTVMVYIPASRTRDQVLPVTYLLHGVMDDQLAWTRAGYADAVLENLIRAQRLKPRILVMPLGYASAQSEKTVRQLLMLPPAGWKGLLETFEKHLLKELMPAVERNFNVSQAASQTEIAGASMGGTQALYIGLKHPELFSKVGSFGAALMIFGTGFDSWFPAEIGSSNQNVQMYCGNEDFTRALHPPFQKWLESKNVKYRSYSHSGGHEWQVWIQDLEQFLTSRKA